MLENFLRARAAIERRSGGLLGPHLDSFVASLSQLGYARETVQKRLRFLYVFERWLVRRGLALVGLQDAVVNNFLEEQRDNGRLAYGGARVSGDDPDLSPCRSSAEGRGPRKGDAWTCRRGRFRPDDELLAYLEGL
jgi:hypothetical protein